MDNELMTLALLARRAHREQAAKPARKSIADLSDDDLERAHYRLLGRTPTLSASDRDILALIEAADLGSDRARNLFAALNEWDQAGARTPQDRSGHEATYCRIAATLIDAILADRAADPALAEELSASLANTRPPLYRCASPSCPGLPYRASEMAHPAGCGGGK